MTPAPLTPANYEALKPRIAQSQRLFNALVRRLDARGFKPGDPLYVAAVRARDAVRDVMTHVHYGSCEKDVGRARE